MGVAQFTFVLVCLAVRREAGDGAAPDELIVPKMIRAANAAVWLVLLVVGGRSGVRVWLARHRRVANT